MSDSLWSEMWRRVGVVLSVAVGGITLVAYFATTNATIAGLSRTLVLSIGVVSLYNAYQIWKSLSDRGDPDQPSAPPQRREGSMSDSLWSHISDHNE
jgi:hypothetical protein